MDVNALKQQFADILNTAPRPTQLMLEALEMVFDSLELSGHSKAALVRQVCGKQGPLHREALELMRNMAILLQAADEMAGQPNLFQVFAAAFMEIYPQPTNEYLRLIASTQARMDLLMCENSCKSEFFRSHFLVE